jgi:predicted enzyme related to lactoylglutathione lyase
MINVTELAFTGRAVTDVARARAFYEGTLGLEPTMEVELENNIWWIEYEMEGGTLAISNAWAPKGHGSTLVAFEVSNLDEAILQLHKLNIPIVWGPLDTPVCRMVGVTDPDGNGITLHHRKIIA